MVGGGKFECACGASTKIEGEMSECEADLTAACSDCGREYIITVTELYGPTEDVEGAGVR